MVRRDGWVFRAGFVSLRVPSADNLRIRVGGNRPSLGPNLIILREKKMFEVSDGQGNHLTSIPYGARFCVNKAELMLKAGYTYDEIAGVFDTTEERVMQFLER